jgi:small-conductance mechanosensitive channel
MSAAHLADRTARFVVQQFAYYAVWAVGFMVMFTAVGLDPQAVVTGLGLTGVALGFALKDILSNLVSGMLVLLMRTFEIGDQIVVGPTEGTVERIELRATHIRTYDGRLVLVPNAEVFTSRVTNNTESPSRRATVDIHLDYQADVPRAMSVVLEAMRAVSGVDAEPAPSMRLRELTANGLHLEARFWTDSQRTDYMNTAAAVRLAAVRALKEAGISLPNPDRRIVTMAGRAELSQDAG